MNERKPASNPVTIVGGRPMHRAVDVAQLPVALEQALTIAALDHKFREAFARDPVGAAASKGIRLDPVEASLVAGVPAESLASMARGMVIPPDVSRRGFGKVVAASIATLVTGKAFLLCSGCTGADSWDYTDGGTRDARPDQAPIKPGAQQKWMTLLGHPCYSYTPGQLVGSDQAWPLLVALHGDGETAISSVKRWQPAADSESFGILGVNWTEEPATPEARAKLIEDLDGIVFAYSSDYSDLKVEPSQRYIASRGVSTDLVWQAAYTQKMGSGREMWASVCFLGGMPQGDWQGDSQSLLANLTVDPPPLYHVIGTLDAEHSAATALAGALSSKGAEVQWQEVEGTTDTAVLDFVALWKRWREMGRK